MHIITYFAIIAIQAIGASFAIACQKTLTDNQYGRIVYSSLGQSVDWKIGRVLLELCNKTFKSGYKRRQLGTVPVLSSFLFSEPYKLMRFFKLYSFRLLIESDWIKAKPPAKFGDWAGAAASIALLYCCQEYS